MRSEEIIGVILDVYGTHWGKAITIDEVRGKSRLRYVVEARQMCCYVLREHFGYGPSAIGDAVNRDHATVIYSHDAVRVRVKAAQEEAVIVSKVLDAAKGLLYAEDGDPAQEDERESIMARLYRKEHRRNAALMADINRERATVMALRNKIIGMRKRIEELERAVQDADTLEPDEWTPEQRKRLEELRKERSF